MKYNEKTGEYDPGQEDMQVSLLQKILIVLLWIITIVIILKIH